MQEKNIFYHFSWLERGNGGVAELAGKPLAGPAGKTACRDQRENRLPGPAGKPQGTLDSYGGEAGFQLFELGFCNSKRDGAGDVKVLLHDAGLHVTSYFHHLVEVLVWEGEFYLAFH